MSRQDIAIIGMAARLPGASTVDEFWSNVRDGVEAIRRLSREELIAAGVPPRDLDDPHYVPACPVLEGVADFDAEFFGVSPRDAAVMDPAHRLFLELAWEAVEHAGHTAVPAEGPVGVFAGSGASYYLMDNVRRNRDLMRSMGEFLARHTNNDMNFLATRVSYEMDLRGPGVNVQTACSTALVAMHMACESIRRGECRMAIAGASTVIVPDRQGYRYEEGEIMSEDGHCRPFDANSTGTVFGSGSGCFVLKPLEAALDDGDTIHAVIRGSAINNDGAQRAGFLAPGVEGQAAVVRRALEVAELSPDDITYIEAHGTATRVGDPIEVEALNQAFRERTQRRRYCALGSVKSNVGHLGEAAAIASLVKAVMALKHRQLPPTVGFEQPNPQIDFSDSPFFVNDRLRDWNSDAPLRCGITALGAGGTNCHLILEEAPAPLAGEGERRSHLFVLSAKSANSLHRSAERLGDALNGVSLADAAYTLSTGRRELPVRLAVAASTAEEARRQLHTRGPEVAAATATAEPLPVVFMFPGGGAQYAGMGVELYQAEAVYRDALDECLAIANPGVGRDLGALMFPVEADRAAATTTLEQPSLTLPALFATEYAMARLLESWGLEPAAFVGHSMGEYVAACLAGVMRLDEAMQLVLLRGRLFERVERGAMLSVNLSEADLRKRMAGGLDIAAVNAPELCVASGPAGAIEQLQKELTALGIDCTRLRIDVAAHSSMLDPILAEFREFCHTIGWRAPRAPFVSNVTGTWITAAEATDPEYWVRHLRSTVRFAAGIEAVLASGPRMLIEVGPGRTLTMLARAGRVAGVRAVNSMRHPNESVSDVEFALRSVGRAWCDGAHVEWSALYEGQLRNRVPLPTYSWDHRRYWIDAPVGGADERDAHTMHESVDRWFERPTWKQAVPPAPLVPVSELVLLFADDAGFSDLLAKELTQADRRVITVRPGHSFTQDGDAFVIRPGDRADVERMLQSVGQRHRLPHRIVHAWGIGAPGGDREFHFARGYATLLAVGQALHAIDAEAPMVVDVLTDGLQRIAGEDRIDAWQALALGPARVMPRELANVRSRSIDVILPATESGRRALAASVAMEIGTGPAQDVVGWRGRDRFVMTLEPIRLEATLPRLKSGGVYLVSGGLGGIGFALATHLAARYQAKLILISRSASSDSARAKASTLTSLGAEVEIVSADVTDLEQTRRAVARGVERFGRVDGVFHAAGVLRDALMPLKTLDESIAVIGPKAQGAVTLDAATSAQSLDFFVMFSSVSSVAGLPGQADYTAANAFLDAFAADRSLRADGLSVSVNWTAWRDVGMAAAIADTAELGERVHPLLRRVPAPDGVDMFGAVLPGGEWVVDEHRVRGGTTLLPGTGYLEIARAAAEAAQHGPGAFEIKDLAFIAPFVASANASRELRVHLGPTVSGRRELTVAGRAAGVEHAPWEEHARGSVGFTTAATPRALPLEEIAARCNRGEEIFDVAQESPNMDFGPRWKNLRSIRYGTNEALVSLELPSKFASDLEDFALHPALMDMATGRGERIAGVDPTREFYVPLSYGRLRMFAPLQRRIFSHVRLAESDVDARDALVFDVTITDERGAVLVDIEGFTMRRLENAAQIQHQTATGVRSPRVDLDAGARRGPALTGWMADAIRTADGLSALEQVINGPAIPQVFAAPEPVRGLIDRMRGVTQAPAAIAAGGEEATGADAPQTDSERALAAIWRELLGIQSVKRTDSFLALGGHSLLAMRMVSRIRKASGISVPLQTVFEAGTLAAIAAVMDDVAAPATPPAAEIRRRDRQDSAPMTLMQQRLWFMEQLHPGRTTYNIPQAQRLTGAIDAAALDRAANALLDRHPALRTVFRGQDPTLQVVLPHRPVTLFPAEDLSAVPKARRETALMERLAELANVPYSLADGPLFTMRLLRLGAEEHVLFLMCHHIVADGLSLLIVQQDLAELYRAYASGDTPRLPDLTVTYGDFAEAHRGTTDQEDVTGQLAHWIETLSALGEPLALPSDAPRPPQPSNRGGTVSLTLTSSQVDAVRSLSASADATLYMALLAAYYVFLHRHTGQTDFVVGFPVHGRKEVAVEHMVGFFANTLPLRVRVEAGDTYRDVLARTRRALIDALRQPDVPFERMVRELRVPRDESRNPVYQTLFALQDHRGRPTAWGAVRSEPLTLPVTGIAEDLTVWLTERPDEVAVDMAYATDLFTAETARLFGRRFVSLVAEATKHPDQAISTLAVMLPEERRLLDEWNDTTAAFDLAVGVHGLITAAAETSPDAVALNKDGEFVTYAELESRSNQLAQLLRARGVRRGSLVGLCVDRGIDMVLSQIAILKAGAAYVPLDPAYPADRLAFMVADAGLALLVTEAANVHAIEWPRGRAVLLDVDAPLIQSQPDTPLVASADDATGEDPAYVIYTSGSTGKPKGVLVPHRAVVNFLRSMAIEPGCNAGDRLLAVTTLSFDIAVLELLLPLTVGAEVVIASREDAQDGYALASLVSATGATMLQATPGTWRALLATGWSGGEGFKALIGGESVPADLARQLVDRAGSVWNMYGPTETTVWSTCWRIERPEQGISIGRPIANTQVWVLDEAGQLTPIGVSGEICIGGQGVTTGYHERPELTASRFIQPAVIGGQRVYRTGDRGRWRTDGLLEHHGRLDFQVKVRGYRIELGEIEATLLTHPRVSNTVVIVREDNAGDARIVAYIVPRDAMPEPASLREHLRASLPEYMIPQHFIGLAAIPALPNGKTDRAALPAPTEGEAPRSAGASHPRTPAEIAIAEIWRELLGVSDIRVTDNFFDLGGHSLLAMTAVLEVEKRLGIRLTVRRMIFETLEQMSSVPAHSHHGGMPTVPAHAGMPG